MKMSLLLSVLICAFVQLSMGDQPVEEVITAKKVQLLGDWFDRSTDSQEVQEVAQYAVSVFNTNSKCKKMFKLLSIESAQTQVTNMINFRIDAILGKTKCFKNENHDLNSCSLEKKRLKCHFEVGINPHNEKYEMQMHNCTKL